MPKFFMICLGLFVAGACSATEVQSKYLRENKNRWWDAKAQLLLFTDSKTPLAKFANQEIDRVVRQDFMQFVLAAKTSVKTRPQYPWFLDIDANLAHAGSDIISVWYERFERRKLNEGKRTRSVMNFAMVNGKPQRVDLSDLSGGLPDALQARVLDMINMERELNGGSPVAWQAAFGQNFAYTPQALVFLLEPSELASSRDQIHKIYLPVVEAGELSSESSLLRNWSQR